ncbi:MULTISPECIES: alpha/beta hydrolase [Paraburkholderia]|jgi:carboxylesterase|uniref:Alpha/beta fold hydrolase n=1 Tax=Paraburkholderia caribensis TaxID=75105 RepID=A0A9Q6SAH9_9BURK|nr:MULTISPECIES: alpha/beta fold hydrolase [Paraburkholderia]AMV48900.1 carboxylesterase [Paraburkholderia caribensis]MCO4876241.1 alpha/beta fold hydrolase [Paraburkholderia caribensis]MDR6380929.1 carboxylesterase [Paraburkholderia caribensis]PTB29755.1 carboxylesterase [Paraburkholderia caribensis]QLB67438.1 carboxylesterase [Paraburkholderia caribensis]
MKTSVRTIFNEGDSHAVLMLHGLSSSPLELRYLARFLNDEGFTTCVPVLNGYTAGSQEQAMEHWLDAATREYDALAARYERVSICGLSIGAALALALVHRRPQAQAVALLSLTLAYDGWAIPWYRFLLNWAYYSPLRSRYRYRESAPYGLRNDALRAKIARAMERDDFSEVGPSTISLPALHEASRLAASVRSQLRAIRNDCLIIHAIDDETSSPRNPRVVSSSIGSSFLRTIWLDDSYHMITSDNEREIVARETALFLRESEITSRTGDAGGKPVVSKALARRLRQLAAMSKGRA